MVDIDAPAPIRNKSRDVNQLFSTPYQAKDGKKFRDCLECSLKRHRHRITDEVTTLRSHLQAHYEGDYRVWCDTSSFTSMLPADSSARKESARLATSKQDQTHLSGYIKRLPPKEAIIPYTDDAFNETALQWLIETNQPLAALQQPFFQNTIHIASRATNGVKIADPVRNTREGIKRAL